MPDEECCQWKSSQSKEIKESCYSYWFNDFANRRISVWLIQLNQPAWCIIDSVKALLFYQSECKHRCSVIQNQYSSPYFVFFSAIGRIILSLKACVIAFILTFQFGDQTHLIVLLFYKYQNQWNEGTTGKWDEIPSSFLLKVLFFFLLLL